jgi:hypothetical protein
VRLERGKRLFHLRRRDRVRRHLGEMHQPVERRLGRIAEVAAVTHP